MVLFFTMLTLSDAQLGYRFRLGDIEQVEESSSVDKIEDVVMLEKIHVYEDDEMLQLIIEKESNTGYEQFFESFTINYYDDYHELRFENFQMDLHNFAKLIEARNLPDISNWYEAPSNVDHSSIYVIQFKFQITYEIESFGDAYIITIKRDIYSTSDAFMIRSESLSLDRLWSHIFTTAEVIEDLSFRILRDDDGYYYVVNHLDSKEEAESLLKVLSKKLQVLNSDKNIYIDRRTDGN